MNRFWVLFLWLIASSVLYAAGYLLDKVLVEEYQSLIPIIKDSSQYTLVNPTFFMFGKVTMLGSICLAVVGIYRYLVREILRTRGKYEKNIKT